MLSLVDGNLPSDLATGDAAQVEEERRLLYVALTRAKDELHCYAPLRMHHHRQAGGVRSDAHGYAAISRFLDEAVQATMQREGVPMDGLSAPEHRYPTPGGVDDRIAALLS